MWVEDGYPILRPGACEQCGIWLHREQDSKGFVWTYRWPKDVRVYADAGASF
eukprot:g2082.t1